MYLPMPAPGAIFEEVQLSLLKGNNLPGGKSGEDGTGLREASGASFSRVLAGEMKSGPETDHSPERTSAKERTAEVNQDRASRTQGQDTVSEEPASGKDPSSQAEGQSAANKGEAGTGLPVEAGLAETLMAWSGLDFGDLNQVAGDPSSRLIPGPVWQDGLPAQLKTRLAADIAAQLTNRGGRQTLTMKLNPEHLGKLDIQFQAKDNHLSVRLVAANPEAETALKENLKELTETIQKQSGRFQQVEVRVDVKTSEDPTDRARDEKPGQSPHDENQGSSRKGQDQHDESDGWDDEAQAARSEAPVQGG